MSFLASILSRVTGRNGETERDSPSYVDTFKKSTLSFPYFVACRNIRFFKKGEFRICKFFPLLTRQKRDRKRKRREKSNWIFLRAN